MKVALISLDQKWEDKEYNLRRCTDLIRRSAALGAEMVVFPEMTLTGFTMNTAVSMENPDASASLNAFAELAKQYQVSVVAGLVLQSGPKAANTLVAFSRDGAEQARYIKIHPFSFANENQFFEAGNSLAKMRIAGFTAGFTICYDLRFPELYSALAKDCNLIINIANWPKRRVHHWKTLLQARAIENQIFIIGVNRTGTDGNGLEYERSSLLVNANGEIMEPIVREDEADIYDINHEMLESFLDQFSTRQDRKPELYCSLL